MPYSASPTRYQSMPYRPAGRSGLKLPAVSLGLWHNFGGTDAFENARDIACAAFDLGITHFDLANNYGPPAGLGGRELRPHPGPRPGPPPGRDHHLHQGRLRHVDRALRRLRIAQVPAGQPGPEPQAAGRRLRGHLLPSPPRSGDAARRDHGGPRPYRPVAARPCTWASPTIPPSSPARRPRILQELGTPCLIHQPSYNMFQREPETGLLPELESLGIGCIAFSPLAQGQLTDRYLQGPAARFPRREVRGLPFRPRPHRGQAGQDPRPGRPGQGARPEPGADGRSPGCCATRA